MSITVSIEEYIRERFDKFYEVIKLHDHTIGSNLQTMLDELESDVVGLAQQKRTSEADYIREEAWDSGFSEGEREGYERGYSDGLDESEE